MPGGRGPIAGPRPLSAFTIMSGPLLDITVSTLGSDGLARFAATRPPSVDGVRYVVSCQSADRPDMPAELRRDDITVVVTHTAGLSNNRNNAMAHVTAPYMLIADDDMVYDAEAIADVIAAFETMPEADILLLRFESRANKPYPPDGHNMSQPWKGYEPSSVEMAMRTDSIRRAKLSFSPLAGIGSPRLGSGEEVLFVRRALLAGLTCIHRDITIGRHPGETTGSRRPTPATMRARGAVMAMCHPWTTPLRIPLEAWRHRRVAGIFRHVAYMTAGAIYAIRHHKQL